MLISRILLGGEGNKLDATIVITQAKSQLSYSLVFTGFCTNSLTHFLFKTNSKNVCVTIATLRVFYLSVQ
jgi:hypothetical protein